jgi:hypothetical protein
MAGGKWNPPIDGAARLASDEEEIDTLELDPNLCFIGGAAGTPVAFSTP